MLGLAVAARRRWARVVISGYSNGGLGTWYFARSYPVYFAAAIPIAFNDTVVGPTPLPVYAIEGTNDELFSSELVRGKVTALADRGFAVSLHERYRGSHLKPCSYVSELTGASAWLDAVVKP